MEKQERGIKTRELILSGAQRLFVERGYKATSLNDICEITGLSKGAIYHHFKSKKEMLDAVTAEHKKGQESYFEATLKKYEMANLKGREKLTKLLEETLSDQAAHQLDVVYHEQSKSADFIVNYMQGCIQDSAPFIASLLEEGNGDGSCQVASPLACAEIFMLMLNVWCDSTIFKCSPERLMDRLRFTQSTMKAMGADVVSDRVVSGTAALVLKLSEMKKEGQ